MKTARTVRPGGRWKRTHPTGHLASGLPELQHARCDVTETVRITLARASDSEAVIIAVSDSSPRGPVIRKAPAGSERGLGLRIVESLSVHWGWHPAPGGKAVFAILAGRTSS